MSELIPANLDNNLVDPKVIFSDGTALNELLTRINDEARSIVPELKTAKGRKQIASVAAKVARSKTFLDGLGKDLVSDLKKRAGAVDAERKRMRDYLDALKEDVRRPLTEWEQAEAARVAGIKARIDDMNITPAATSGEIQAQLDRLESVPIDDTFAELAAEAEQAKGAGCWRLRQALEQAEAAEAKAAEERRQRQEAEERARREREERIAREAAERAVRETERRFASQGYRVDAAPSERPAPSEKLDCPFAPSVGAESARSGEVDAKAARSAVIKALRSLSLTQEQALKVLAAIEGHQIPHVFFDMGGRYA